MTASAPSFRSKVMQGLRRGSRALFGDLQWQPPRWLARLGQALAWMRAHPRHTAAWALAMALAALAGLFAWHWYTSRPQPVLTTFEVSAPAATCYACEPPGDPQPLIVTFSDSAAPLEQLGQPLDAPQAGIRLSPAIQGQWRWDDERTLMFQPAHDWPVGQRYQVSLSRRHSVAPQITLQDDEFSFASPAFQARLDEVQFHQDPVVAADKKVVATLVFSHPVAPDSLERRIRLRLYERINDSSEKELSAPEFTVLYDRLKLQAYVHTQTLEVPPKSGRLVLTVEPGVRAARGGDGSTEALQSEVTIPGLNSLEVAEMSLDIVRDDRNEPDQVLLVRTSFSVPEQDFPGHVQAWLLPRQHPDPKLRPGGSDADRPFHWTASTLRPEVLNDDTRLPLEALPGEQDHNELHSLRYQAEPGRYIYVRISAGMRSFGGYVLGESVERIIQVPQFPREVAILQEGSLLALSGDHRLSLMARNVPALKVEVGRVQPHQLQHLVSQSSGSFQMPFFYSWHFQADNIIDRFEKIITLPQADPARALYESVDLGEYLQAADGERRGIFMVRVQGWDPARKRVIDGRGEQWNDARDGLSDARLIVVTDMGLVIKRNAGNDHDVFVQSIATGEPVAGAQIQVIAVNGQSVLNRTTDAQGHAHLPDLSSYQRERSPVMVLARLGQDSSFLPLDYRGQVLEMSRFDVGGLYVSAEPGALNAYLFSDRGIYRPGEDIRIGALVRSQDWQRSLNGLPLRLEITDPQGTVIRRETFRPGPAGFGEILQPTKLTSPTGIYTVMLSVVRNERRADTIGSTTVQVRDFQPDRLRMSARFSAQSANGWVAPDELSAEVELENLFGTPAQDRRVTAELVLSPAVVAFGAFPDYRFHDPLVAEEGFREDLVETTTDAAGKATLDLNLQRFARATYRVQLITQGFEADGGRGVSAAATQLVSSMPYLIGYKADGDLDYLPRNSERTINLIAIAPDATLTQVDGLTLARLETRYVSVLTRQDNGTYKYESRRKETALEETPLNLPASAHALRLDTATPGSFAYVVRDTQGQQLMRLDYEVAGEGNVSRTLEQNAELEMTLSKRDYQPGEDIELSIRAPYEGAGLITIERERVYTWKWFKASTTSSVQRIRLPDDLEGNAYVSVALVRDPGSSQIYTSPLSYGVQSFAIDIAARRNAVTVNAPARVKPGQTLTIDYSTQRPSRLVLFAVDEGILQVAGYQTPDPLGHFFQKRALQVYTTQILDLILPQFSQLMQAAPGGDAESLLGRHLNPFRRKGEPPVAFWSGIVDADTTTRQLTYEVPDYFNGTLRIMAVAVTDAAVGVHESRTIVRGDFVMSPNAPTTVSPGDEFEVSLGLANNVEGSGAQASIDISLQAGSGLEIIGDARQRMVIAEGSEDAVRFRLRAGNTPGAVDLRFAASTHAGGKQASGQRSIDLSVRPATPYRTQLRAGLLPPGQQDAAVERKLYPHHRRLQVGASMLPLQFAHGFSAYLANYPYVCTEQIVSQAMPAVLLGSRPEFGEVRSQPGGDIAALLGELRARQNGAGAYRVWPGSQEVAEFVSLYAQQLLIEAGERDQPAPGDLLSAGNEYLRQLAGRDGDSLADERHSAYAIYLLTRQGQRMAGEAAALRQRLNERYREQWQRDPVAGWLAGAFKLMRQENEARAMISAARFSDGQGDELYNDAMTRDALLLFILSKHFPERLEQVPGEVFATMAGRITSGYYHSLSAGTTLLALDAYASATEAASRDLSIAEVLANKQVRPLPLPEGILPRVDFSDQATALRFDNRNRLDGYYLIEESGFDLDPPQEAIREGLEVVRQYTDLDGKPIGTLTLGQQVDVHLRLRALGDRVISNVALVDLLPGGFELVVPSVTQEDDLDNQGDAFAGWICQVCIGTPSPQLRYADMREDRVVFYANATSEVTEVVYRIRATNTGSFTVPPAHGEAMYDRSVIGRSAAGRIEVARP